MTTGPEATAGTGPGRPEPPASDPCPSAAPLSAPAKYALRELGADPAHYAAATRTVVGLCRTAGCGSGHVAELVRAGLAARDPRVWGVTGITLTPAGRAAAARLSSDRPPRPPAPFDVAGVLAVFLDRDEDGGDALSWDELVVFSGGAESAVRRAVELGYIEPDRLDGARYVLTPAGRAGKGAGA